MHAYGRCARHLSEMLEAIDDARWDIDEHGVDGEVQSWEIDVFGAHDADQYKIQRSLHHIVNMAGDLDKAKEAWFWLRNALIED